MAEQDIQQLRRRRIASHDADAVAGELRHFFEFVARIGLVAGIGLVPGIGGVTGAVVIRVGIIGLGGVCILGIGRDLIVLIGLVIFVFVAFRGFGVTGPLGLL